MTVNDILAQINVFASSIAVKTTLIFVYAISKYNRGIRRNRKELVKNPAEIEKLRKEYAQGDK